MKQQPTQGGVKTLQELITPERAESYLTKNKRNRAISDSVVNSYALDMKNNNWLLNHQGLAFNDRGELIDGQHRLEAIKRAGVPVLMHVTTGLRDEQRNGVIVNVMDTVDRGRGRRIGQQLGLFHGIANGNRVAATVTAICHFLFGDSRNLRLTTAQVLHLVKLYLADVEAIYSQPDAGVKMPSFISAPIVMLHNSDPDTAMSFTTKLLSLEGLTAASPVMALIRWREHHQNARAIRASTMKVVASCLHHYKRGNSIKKVYASDEAANWLIGLQKHNERKVREILNLPAR